MFPVSDLKVSAIATTLIAVRQLSQLLCGYLVVPVQSQITVSRPIRHTLPPELESLFGSSVNGRCSSTFGTNSEICDGTSVLNDGILPALSGVSRNDTASQWANELFTMRRSGTDPIVASFEIPSVSHNQMELTVFNCPQFGIYAPQAIVYAADSQKNNLMMMADETLSSVSCEHLQRICVQFSGGTGIPNFNLVFPYQNNSDFVFLGEVTFLNDPNIPECGSPELITMRVTPPPSTTDPTTMTMGTSASITTGTANSNLEERTSTLITVINEQSVCQCTVTAITTGVSSVIITAITVAGISIAIQISIYQCFYKLKLRSISGTPLTATGEDHNQMEAGGGDAVVYEVVDERVGTTLEMKENETYRVNKRVGGLEMKQNEAYGITRST